MADENEGNRIEPGEIAISYGGKQAWYRFQQVDALSTMSVGDSVLVTYTQAIPQPGQDSIDEKLFENVQFYVESLGPSRKSALLLSGDIRAERGLKLNLPYSAKKSSTIFILEIKSDASITARRAQKMFGLNSIDVRNIDVFRVECWAAVVKAGQTEKLYEAFKLVFGEMLPSSQDHLSQYLAAGPATLPAKRAALRNALDDLGVTVDAVVASVVSGTWDRLCSDEPHVLSVFYRDLDRAALAKLADAGCTSLQPYHEAMRFERSRGAAYAACISKVSS